MITRSIKISIIVMCLVVLTFHSPPVFSADKASMPGNEQEFTDGAFADAAYSEFAPILIERNYTPDATQIRTRMVKVNFNEFLRQAKSFETGISNASAQLIELNLFDDAWFVVNVDKVEKNQSGGFTLFGRIMDNEPSSVIITVLDDVMIGSVAHGNDNYTIRYFGGNIHEIAQTDHSNFPECEEPELSNPLPSEKHPELNTIMADTGITLDIMVVYTAAARIGAGSVAAMQATINQAVAETNTGYLNSQVKPRIRLVYTTEVTYSETGFNWYTCLNRLAGKTDGYIDNVHSLRNTYKADIVVMVCANTTYNGLAKTIMATESSAFCMVTRRALTGIYTMAHEMGHLQGARHDRYVDGVENRPYTDNHGYTHISTTGSWRTIMAYTNACSAAGVSCIRINYWSNPNVQYNGYPTGKAGGVGVGADNHKCLNNTAYTVAQFRLAGN